MRTTKEICPASPWTPARLHTGRAQNAQMACSARDYGARHSERVAGRGYQGRQHCLLAAHGDSRPANSSIPATEKLLAAPEAAAGPTPEPEVQPGARPLAESPSMPRMPRGFPRAARPPSWCSTTSNLRARAHRLLDHGVRLR